MRLLHPRTLEIAACRDDIPKTVISHVWSEIFKWKASGQKHPKMFIDHDEDLGCYMAMVFKYGTRRGCNLDESKLHKLGENFVRGVDLYNVWDKEHFQDYFNDSYLFSDACSLYYKGINIFPDIFPSEDGKLWRKYVPVESHKEIVRQCEKTLNK